MWYVDTCYNNHMCGSQSSFSYLNEGFRFTMSFCDWSIMNVMGKCDIEIRTKNCFVEKNSNVLYVHDLKGNLLSAGQWEENVYEITIKKGACKIYDPSRGAIDVVQMSSNRLFPLKSKSAQSCLMAQVKDFTWLWIFCYGHLNFGGLQTLQRKNMLVGLLQIAIPSQVCEECFVGKQHRSSFLQRKSRRAKNILETVHFNICRPINPSSDGGNKYLIIFIDDYSWKAWVYFLQPNSKAFNVFKSFKAHVENEAGKVMKTFVLIVAGNTFQKSFKPFVLSKVSENKSQLPIHHNRMVY